MPFLQRFDLIRVSCYALHTVLICLFTGFIHHGFGEWEWCRLTANQRFAGDWQERWVVLKDGFIYLFEHEGAEWAEVAIAVENVPTMRDSSVVGPPRDDG